MPLLKVEAEKLSSNDLVRGVIEEIIDKDDLFAILPFMKSDGKAHVYNREKTISEAEFLDPYDAVPEGAATFEEVTAKLRVLAGDVDVDNFLNETMSDESDQLSIQIAKKAKGLARKFRRTLVEGNSTTNAKEFDGLANLVPAGKVLDQAGESLTFSALDELLDAIPNGADVIVMRSEHIRALRALLRAAGGLEPAHVMMENFGRPMLTHNGIPVIVNDFIAKGSVTVNTVPTDVAPIYAVRLNETDGLHGLYGGDAAGVRVQNIGQVQDKDSTRIRLKWYVSLALKSTQSLAQLKDVAI